MKKPDKVNYTISNPISGPSHFPVSRVKSAHKNLQGAVNLLTESNFLMEKMSMRIKKIRMHLKPCFL